MREETDMISRVRCALLAAALVVTSSLAACSLPGTTPTAAEETPTAPATEASPAGGTSLAPAEANIDAAIAAVNWPVDAAVARVNGVDISTDAWREDVTRQLRLVTAYYQVDWTDQVNLDRLPAFLDGEVERMVSMELLRQIAERDGIVITDEDVQQQVQTAEQEIISGGQYDSLESFMKANDLTREKFETLIREQVLADRMVAAHGGPSEVEQIHARHILLDDEKTAQEVKDKLAAGESFEDLAKIHSTDTTNRDQGGDLGWFPRDMMVPEFDEAAFALQPGETSDIVKTQFGYHIIRVDERGVRALEEPILGQVREQNFSSWLEEERKAADIELFYMASPTGAAPTAEPAAETPAATPQP